MEKKELRIEMKKKLSLISLEEKNIFSRKASDYFVNSDLYNKVDYILSYCDLKSEISPKLINKSSLEHSKKLALPKISDSYFESGFAKMDFYFIDNDCKMESGLWNIQEPLALRENLFIAEKIFHKKICVIVPALAFDKKLNRLGKGKAFYDIYLKSLIETCKKNNNELFLVGLCFSEQIIDSVPVDSNDIKMNCLLSEKGFYFFESTE